MKIAFIALKDLPYIGGIEKYTEELGFRLVNDGFEVTVYTSGRLEKKPRMYRGLKIVPVYTLQLKGFERLILSRIATLKAAFSNADIIHYNGFENTLLSCIPKLFGKKVIYQGHGLEWERDRWGKIPVLYFKLINFIINKFPRLFFDHGTVVSKYQKNYYMKKYNNDFEWIPTGINITSYLNPSLIKKYNLKGNDYIFFAARLVREKGAHSLISAFKKLKFYGPVSFKLVIAGDAPDEKVYREYLKTLVGSDKDIIFTGSISGDLLVEFYSNARLFVLPSTIEGMPISLIEAMSFGVPTLSSDIEPNRETTLNGLLGYHFKNRNIEDLVNRIIELTDKDNPEISDKALLAQQYVKENFTWDQIYEQFKKIYIN